MMSANLGLYIFSAAILFLGSRIIKRRGLRLPPGPPQLPLLGNLLQVPAIRPWVKFTEWANVYGDVVYLNVFGQPIVILSSAEAVTDLLVKRGAHYSDRPQFIMTKLSGWGDTFGAMPYGGRFRQARRLSSRSLNAHAVSQYEPVHSETTTLLLSKLRQSPERFADHLRWAAGSSILRIAYGFDVKDDDDPLIQRADVAMDIFSKASAPGWVVDSFPSLRYIPTWFPGAGFRRQANIWREQVTEMIQVPFNMVKERLQAGGDSVTPDIAASFTATLLVDEDGNPASKEDEELITSLSGSLYGGGADTTVSAMLSFFLAMTLYPEIQKKAQDEVISLTGGARLPTLEDRKNLPYIEAIVWEVQRWNPVVPLGLPHCCLAEDEYRGFRIPAGSIVFANIWKILHDEKRYPEPLAFKPERYLSRNKVDAEGVNVDPRTYAFGFGRRECPGRFVADHSVWLMIASILATFDISRAKDDDGREIPAKVDYTGAIICHPHPFECSIKPKSATVTLIAGQRT